MKICDPLVSVANVWLQYAEPHVCLDILLKLRYLGFVDFIMNLKEFNLFEERALGVVRYVLVYHLVLQNAKAVDSFFSKQY